MPYTLSRHEVADLFRDSVDTARLGIQQSLAGSEKVGEVVKPKLTIDLSHKNIENIPEEIIDVLKKDVERYGPLRSLFGDGAPSILLWLL